MSERLRSHPLTIAELCHLRQELWAKVVRYLVPFKDKLKLPSTTEAIPRISVPKQIYTLFDFITETDTPAEDWLTTTALANEIGVEYEWVNRRLLFLTAPGEFRIGSAGSKLHMHPDALEELEEIRSKSIIDIDSQRYINLDQLAETLGRHRLWVSNRLQNTEVSTVLGLDKTGKSVMYYDRELLAVLTEKRDQYSDAEDMLTIRMIAEQAGKDREWVEAEIEELGLVPELRRFPQSGRVDICFQPHEAALIVENAKKYLSAPKGWKTENALVELTGKSFNWVHRRLKRFKVTSQSFEDSHGVLRKHFPPPVVGRLLQEAMDSGENLIFQEAVSRLSKTGIDMLRKVVEMRGPTIAHESLLLMDVSEEDIRTFMKMGYLTRWSSGQYYFTKKAEQVVTRIKAIEQGEKSLQALIGFMNEFGD